MEELFLGGRVREIGRAIKQVVVRAGPVSLCLWTFLLATFHLCLQMAAWPLARQIPAGIAFAWLLVPFVALADGDCRP